jgi:hypothetical protein
MAERVRLSSNKILLCHLSVMRTYVSLSLRGPAGLTRGDEAIPIQGYVVFCYRGLVSGRAAPKKRPAGRAGGSCGGGIVLV